MKQRITFDQLSELTDDQKEWLRGWWKPIDGDQALCEKYGVVTIHINGEYEEDEPLWINCQYYLMAENPLPLLNIGQMIECLQGLNKDWTLNGSSWDEPDICDRLWERLKYYL